MHTSKMSAVKEKDVMRERLEQWREEKAQKQVKLLSRQGNTKKRVAAKVLHQSIKTASSRTSQYVTKSKACQSPSKRISKERVTAKVLPNGTKTASHGTSQYIKKITARQAPLKRNPKQRVTAEVLPESRKTTSHRTSECIKKESTAHQSPSMRIKLEEWRTKKDFARSEKRDYSVKPFRCGNTAKPLPLTTPAKASERIQQLMQSSSKTIWRTQAPRSEVKHRFPKISPLRNVQRQSKTCFKSRKSSNLRRKSEFVFRNNKSHEDGVGTSTRRETYCLSVKGEVLEKAEDVIKKQLDFAEKEKDAEKTFSKMRDDNKEEFCLDLSSGVLDEMNEKLESKVGDIGSTSGNQGTVRRETFDLLQANKVAEESSSPVDIEAGIEATLAQETEICKDHDTLYSHLREGPSRPKTVLSMREKLEQWLAGKGKTPRKVTRLISTPRLSKKRRSESVFSSLSQDDAMSVEETMNSCRQLSHEGCPPQLLLDWLEELKLKLPELDSTPAYLDCCKELRRKAFIISDKENMRMDQAQDSITSSPFDHLSTPKFVTSKPPKSAHRSTRRTRNALTPINDNSPASQIKFHVKQATPYFQRIKRVSDPEQLTPSILVTPVRRSVRVSKRRSVMNTPSNFDDCFDHLSEIPIREATQLILRSNNALNAEFDLDMQTG